MTSNSKALLFAVAAAAGIYFISGGHNAGGSAGISAAEMRNALLNWVSSNTTDSDYSKRLAIEAFNEMTDQELTAAYQWVFNRKQIQPDLSNLSQKYNLFT